MQGERRLRMELLNIYDRRINADCFSASGSPWQGAGTDEAALVDTCAEMRQSQIKWLAMKLDRLDIILWHSHILSEYLHTHGVNIRYLGTCGAVRHPGRVVRQRMRVR